MPVITELKVIERAKVEKPRAMTPRPRMHVRVKPFESPPAPKRPVYMSDVSLPGKR